MQAEYLRLRVNPKNLAAPMRFFAPLALIAALLASCAGPTPEPPPSRSFQPSYERPPVDATAEEVDRSTSNVRREADALRNQVGNLRIVASEATKASKTARAELDRLVAQKSATEAELSDLSRLFKDLEQRNMFLEAEADQLEVDHVRLNETVEKLETTVKDLRVATTRKDEEVAELRQLLKAANDHNDDLHSTNERLAEAAAKAEVKQAATKTYRNLMIWGGVALFLLALFWVAVRTGLLTLTGR